MKILYDKLRDLKLFFFCRRPVTGFMQKRGTKTTRDTAHSGVLRFKGEMQVGVRSLTTDSYNKN